MNIKLRTYQGRSFMTVSLYKALKANHISYKWTSGVLEFESETDYNKALELFNLYENESVQTVEKHEKLNIDKPKTVIKKLRKSTLF